MARRLDRYDYTNNWNLIINSRQFGGIPGELNLSIGAAEGGAQRRHRRRPHDSCPVTTLRPTRPSTTGTPMTVGDTAIELRHARGETDDHLWAWLPDRKWIMAGDFVIWNFPNAGNPQKVQRYPLEWAAALRDMIAAGPELLVPAHGLPIAGPARIAMVLDDIATALESLVAEVIAMMNQGATLDTIIHTVAVPAETLAKPYLRPLYDEPEFVIRNIWRQFGGWWDGAASRLKPSPDGHLATVIAELAGGAAALIRRAEQAVSRQRSTTGVPPRRSGRLGRARRSSDPCRPGCGLHRATQRRVGPDEQGHLHGRGSRIAGDQRIVSSLATPAPMP